MLDYSKNYISSLTLIQVALQEVQVKVSARQGVLSHTFLVYSERLTN